MASNFAIGIPNVLNPIPNISSVPGILAIPNLSRILNVQSIAAMQSIPGILGIVKAASTGQIPSLPGIDKLLNVSSLGALVRISGVSSLLNFDSLTGGLMKSDGPGAKKQSQTTPFWGILPALSTPGNGSAPVLQADSVLSFEFKNSTRISKFPQEKGAFQSYNKVQSPFESRVTFTRGGTESDRARFLQAIEDISNSLELFDIVTPERVYHDANVYDYNLVRRATNGIGLISVEVMFEEVRVTAVTQFSGTVAPDTSNQALDTATQLNFASQIQTQVQSVAKNVAGIVGIPSVPSAFSQINLGNIQGMVANNAGAVVGRIFNRR